MIADDCNIPVRSISRASATLLVRDDIFFNLTILCSANKSTIDDVMLETAFGYEQSNINGDCCIYCVLFESVGDQSGVHAIQGDAGCRWQQAV